MIIIIDDFTNTLYVNRSKINLSKMEFLFYSILTQKKQTTINAEHVVESIWPRRKGTITQNNLSQLAFKLKKKMGEAEVPISITASIRNGCTISHDKFNLIIRIKEKSLSRLIFKYIIFDNNAAN